MHLELSVEFSAETFLLGTQVVGRTRTHVSRPYPPPPLPPARAASIFCMHHL